MIQIIFLILLSIISIPGFIAGDIQYSKLYAYNMCDNEHNITTFIMFNKKHIEPTTNISCIDYAIMRHKIEGFVWKH